MSYNNDNDERRQRLIVAQSSLERAIDYCSWINLTDNDIPAITSVAGQFFDWVISQGDGSAKQIPAKVVDSGKTISPVPTKIQQEWIDKIQTKHPSYTAQEMFCHYGKYPSSKEEALECIRTLNNKNC